MNVVFPCGLLPPDHELATGTLKHIEKNMSVGGLPLHLEWMKDGIWVALALDNVVEVHLARGDADTACQYLYRTLNHGTPLFTWCEERGEEPDTEKASGDRQHLWTPLAVVRIVHDMLIMEDGDGLQLARGTARQWLGSGKPLGIAEAPTHFGETSFETRFDAAKSRVTDEATFCRGREPAWAVMNIRLPGKLKVKTVTPESGATVLPDGEGIVTCKRYHERAGVSKKRTLGSVF